VSIVDPVAFCAAERITTDPFETPGCFADRKNDIDAPLHIADGGSLVANISSRKPTNSTYETRESS